jgi:hypothetical protein
MSNKLVSVRSGITDQRTTLSLQGTLFSAVSANSIRRRHSDANKSLGLSRTPLPLYGTRRLATQFTRVPIWSLTRDKCLQFIPFQRISSRSILILSCHQLLSFPSCLFHSVFPTKALYAFLILHACYMLCASYFSIFNHHNNKC